MLKPKIMKTKKIQTRPQSGKGDVSLSFVHSKKIIVFITIFMGFLMYEKIYLATKGAGLLGKTEWTDDEDEEEEGVAIEDVPTLPETVYDAPPDAEEATLLKENQTEENQEAHADVPTSPTEARPEVDDRPEVEPEVQAE